VISVQRYAVGSEFDVMNLRNLYHDWRARRARARDLALSAAIKPESLAVPLCEDAPDVSIIIPTYGQLRFTLQCLKSILDSGTKATFEVIVAEDSSGDKDILRLRDIPGLVFYVNETNLGFLRSCNAAATRARGRYLYFLNNDTRIMPGAIDALVELAERRPDAGLVGSKLIYPHGRLQEAGGIIWSDASGWNFGRLDDPDRCIYNYVRECDYISGASILLPRALWEQLGGFDEHFAPAYCEDSDLAFRVRKAGFKVLYQPRSVVVHYEGISHGTDTASGGKAYQVINQRKLQGRWQCTLASEHCRPGGSLIRARDHALTRRVMLVVDHYIPEPDRDAGSRSMITFMQAALDNGWVVKFWPQNCKYTEGYGQVLEEMGIEVLVEKDNPPLRSLEGIGHKGLLHLAWSHLLRRWLTRNGRDIDCVFLSRPFVAERALAIIRATTQAPIFYYGHDLHFARMRLEAEFNPSPRAWKTAEKMESLERRIWEGADTILYPSQAEADEVISRLSTLDARALLPYAFDSFVQRAKQPEGKRVLFVAGFAHPPNVDAALWLARDVWPQVVRDHPDARLTLAGSNPHASVRALAGEAITVTGFVSDVELARLYAISKVAVVPLRFGAGVKLKVVEAMQMGLPLVTTTVGAQGLSDLADAAVIKDDPQHFAAAISTFLADDSVALKHCAAQSAYVSRTFSMQAMRSQIDDLFGDIKCQNASTKLDRP